MTEPSPLPRSMSSAEDAERAAGEAGDEVVRLECLLIDAQAVHRGLWALCEGGKAKEEATEGTPLYRARVAVDTLTKELVEAKNLKERTYKTWHRLSRHG